MIVTAEHVAELRAYILGDLDAYGRMHASHTRTGEPVLPVLVAEAFVRAVRRRFSPQWREGDVIRFVAEIRARSAMVADAIDPRGAEQLMKAALGVGTAHALPPETKRLQLPLLVDLVADAGA